MRKSALSPLSPFQNISKEKKIQISGNHFSFVYFFQKKRNINFSVYFFNMHTRVCLKQILYFLFRIICKEKIEMHHTFHFSPFLKFACFLFTSLWIFPVDFSKDFFCGFGFLLGKRNVYVFIVLVFYYYDHIPNIFVKKYP